MSSALYDYIKTARDKKASDTDIHAVLVGSGWPEAQVKSALAADPSLPPPPPAPSVAMSAPAAMSVAAQPIAVSSGASTRGFEYTIMFIALWVFAFCLGGSLHNLASSMFGGDAGGGAFYSSGILVGFPVFAFLFFRTKKSERTDPSVLQDPSRKRAVQLTMIVSFLFGLGHIVFYVYSLLGGESSPGPIENFLHMIITVMVAGGIFAYYWIDDHKSH